MNAVQMALVDGVTIAKRNVIKVKRAPDMLGFVIMSPIMFVLLFAYVLGSAITIPGMSYREFLLPGIFTQTMIFGASLTGLGLATDLQKGIIDRFRSLPMSSSALLIGRTTSDVLMNVISLVVMALSGFVVGWRIHTSPQKALLGFLVLLLFAYALSWVTATVGLAIRSVEVYNNASFMVIFPLSFIANTFVDGTKLPGPLKYVAEWNPASSVTQAARESFGNTSRSMPVSHAWPLQHAVLASVLWSLLLLVVFVPLSTWRYKKAVSR